MTISKRSFLAGMLAAPALVTLTGLRARAEAAGDLEQAPGYYRYRVGDIRVTALLDGYMAIPSAFVLGYDEAQARAAAARSHHRFSEGQASFAVNGYVIETGAETILIDAGAPAALGPGMGGLTDNLHRAGFAPGDITTVLMTHLHIDHVGGLSGPDGAPRFDNAAFVCAREEWDFLHDDAVRAAAPEEFRPILDLARGMVAPYAARRREFSGEGEIVSGITAIPLPGHTPGHTGYAIHSGNESLLIWGDIIHLPQMQFAHPEWGVVFDTDPGQARETRMRLFDRASADGMTVAGMHVDFPGIGYVERSAAGFRHVPAPWLPA